MNKNVLFFVSLLTLITSAYSAEPIALPEVPTATEIEKAVMPPKGGCEQCGVENTILDKVKSDIAFLKSKYECKEGKKRLAEDKTFYIKTGGNIGGSKTITGNFQDGAIMQGEISESFAGVSAFNDLMFVTEVKEGKRIVGYNITLSMCEVPNSFDKYPALVSDRRPLRNFSAPYGITLGHNTACGMGVVEMAHNTVVISQKSQKREQQALTSAIPIYTSFVRVNCN